MGLPAMQQVADKEMVENAVGGGDEYDALAIPPYCEFDAKHELWGDVYKAICEVYDPEIPVNIFELGLIYKFDFTKMDDGQYDVYVQMSLTSPACPVAQEMPGMVQSALFPIDKVGAVDVEIVWDPTWDPAFMAETAKLQLNMFT
jgi:metal-sulfur cluster biosynthetic enzyme